MYRVIIVEDEMVIRKWLTFSVPWEDLDCTVAGEGSNGEEGLALIKKESPDIVIADINMPVMDGLEMIAQSYEDYYYVAVILSGYSTFEYAQKAIKYGVLEYLLKPVDLTDLKNAIVKCKEKIEMRRLYLENRQSSEEWKKLSIWNEQTIHEASPIVTKLLEYIKKHYQEKVTIRNVSAEFHYSENYLNKKFKESMGTTFIEYLNRYRIQKSIDLLKEGNIRVQDIAWRCGFGEYKYYNVVFKKYVGCTPKEYQNIIKH